MGFNPEQGDRGPGPEGGNDAKLEFPPPGSLPMVEALVRRQEVILKRLHNIMGRI